MPPNYNPWGTPVFPGDTAPQPYENYASAPVANLLSSIAGALGKAFMAPGQALQSTTPITSDQMVKPAADLAMMTTLGAGAVPQEANSLNMGIKAYHGSPHDFDAFDLSKIGTGEGAQAYGHGLYFADNEGVARSYRDALSGGGMGRLSVGGAPSSGNAVADTMLASHAGDVDAAIKTLSGHAATLSEAQRARGGIGPALDTLEKLRGTDVQLREGPGRMYEVNINADPEHFLDWDKPLGQQPQAVKDAFAKQLEQFGPDAKTQAQMMIAGSRHPQGMQGVTQDLAAKGIPGIKYLDQGSRASGDGSRNYVVFNDKLIDIMRKYAIPGLLGAPIFAGEQKS